MIQTLFGSTEKKPGFFDRMKEAVTRTRENLTQRIEEVVAFSTEIDRATLDDLEATLIGADLGAATTHEVVERRAAGNSRSREYPSRKSGRRGTRSYCCRGRQRHGQDHHHWQVGPGFP